MHTAIGVQKDSLIDRLDPANDSVFGPLKNSDHKSVGLVRLSYIPGTESESACRPTTQANLGSSMQLTETHDCLAVMQHLRQVIHASEIVFIPSTLHNLVHIFPFKVAADGKKAGLKEFVERHRQHINLVFQRHVAEHVSMIGNPNLRRLCRLG
ncbi:hypothetical protein [Cynomolgus macaque cytomegalovirus strain Mauritius]|uniref:Uncharacterized protein n=1 Tax=Cynomolgus macaque cytomegalovirus strain Mauritius TaxID=1690255 RepID=A0A0K1H004_9BETA|nr:hypothetical protein [Cynomolgus macaque cytomegalovirus strain Mauritius]AXG21736.1 hypothetical protein [synthetic construct]AXG22004.1 hypothetical protein [synthetic construct]